MPECSTIDLPDPRSALLTTPSQARQRSTGGESFENPPTRARYVTKPTSPRKMKNVQTWAPTKFVLERGRFRASPNPKELSPGSRLLGDLLASCYQTHLKSHCRGRLLDLGCGKVPFYGLYREYVSETVCVDWHNSSHGNDYLDAECDLTKDLPFSDACFDTILLSDVLEHIPTPGSLWREMGRLLKPGGKLLLNVPFYYYLHEEPYDYYRYTKYALLRFAETTGFEIILIKEVGGAPEIVVDIVSKSILRFGPIGEWTAVALQAACWSLVTSPLGARISEKTAKQFPLGYFMIAQKPCSLTEATGSD
jgi:SAM-dependent methyltransferase